MNHNSGSIVRMTKNYAWSMKQHHPKTNNGVVILQTGLQIDSKYFHKVAMIFFLFNLTEFSID